MKKRSMSFNDPRPVLVARVKYHGLTVGELTRAGDLWTFNYSLDFQMQSRIAPITDFPDKTQLYTSSVLWPFFALRVPSLNQPPIEKRQIRFASMEDVLKLTPKINKQFKVAFDILAK